MGKDSYDSIQAEAKATETYDDKYKDEAADLVLISSDGVRFRVYSIILKISR